MSAAPRGFKTKPDDTLKSAGSMSPHFHRDRLALKFHREGLFHRKPRGGLQCLKPSPPEQTQQPGWSCCPLPCLRQRPGPAQVSGRCHALPRGWGSLHPARSWGAGGGIFPGELERAGALLLGSSPRPRGARRRPERGRPAGAGQGSPWVPPAQPLPSPGRAALRRKQTSTGPRTHSARNFTS